MQQTGSTRILMYSHDTYGLGHLTRTVRIARALRARHASASILILTGSPVAPYMPLPEGADLVKLPSVVKSGPESYRSRDLGVSFSQVKRIRRDLIRRAAESFRPHLFLVDNVPLGMKGEILPTLRWLRTSSPETKIALDLRDILDDPTLIRDTWRRDAVPEILESFYDRIFVLGDASVFDAAQAYALPVSKTIHLGYGAPAARSSQRRVMKPGRASRILLTVGGGGDGADFLERALVGLSEQEHREAAHASLRVEVITGPLMDPGERRSIAARALEVGAIVHEFVPNLPSRMARADLVVAMAGYNTCCEILSHARAALVVPRRTPRVEQLLRAEAFERRGLVRMIPSIDCEPKEIADAVHAVLRDGPGIDEGRLPAIDGFARLAEEAGLLCPSLIRSGPIPTPRGSSGTARGEAKRRESETPQLSMRGSVWYWSGTAAGMSPGARSARL